MTIEQRPMTLADISPNFRVVNGWVHIPDAYTRYMQDMPKELKTAIRLTIYTLSRIHGRRQIIYDEFQDRESGGWQIPIKEWDKAMEQKLTGWQWRTKYNE